MMYQSTFDPKIKVRSMTVKEYTDFALVDFEKEDPIQYINGIAIKCSSLSMIQNNVIGLLIMDILHCSNIRIDDTVKDSLKRISSLASTHLHIFNTTNNDKPELKQEIKELYDFLYKEIQPDINRFLKDKMKLIKIGIQPSEIDQLPFWEFEKYLQML